MSNTTSLPAAGSALRADMDRFYEMLRIVSHKYEGAVMHEYIDKAVLDLPLAGHENVMVTIVGSEGYLSHTERLEDGSRRFGTCHFSLKRAEQYDSLTAILIMALGDTHSVEAMNALVTVDDKLGLDPVYENLYAQNIKKAFETHESVKKYVADKPYLNVAFYEPSLFISLVTGQGKILLCINWLINSVSLRIGNHVVSQLLDKSQSASEIIRFAIITLLPRLVTYVKETEARIINKDDLKVMSVTLTKLTLAIADSEQGSTDFPTKSYDENFDESVVEYVSK